MATPLGTFFLYQRESGGASRRQDAWIHSRIACDRIRL